jgi:two-component system, NtrC family, response regulator AtoC
VTPMLAHAPMLTSTDALLPNPRLALEQTHGMLTVAPEMHDLFEIVRRVARTDTSVLVRGETGTGKELVARAMHDCSARAGKPFRALNCATLTPELLSSELFGHVKGAYTGAIRERKGLFLLADGGTVFLDEVAELPLDLQARLLRVLQERSFVPLGGSEPVQVDVRIVSATHQSLREAVDQKRFRADLMYRLRVVPIFLPRLVERTGDVEALLWHFIEHFNTQGPRHITFVATDALEAMLSYDWPGNIRELRNVVEYAFAIGDGEVLGLHDLTPEIRGEAPQATGAEPRTAFELERKQLIEALAAARGRRAEAAERLGMSRTTLWRKLREHGIA